MIRLPLFLHSWPWPFVLPAPHALGPERGVSWVPPSLGPASPLSWARPHVTQRACPLRQRGLEQPHLCCTSSQGAQNGVAPLPLSCSAGSPLLPAPRAGVRGGGSRAWSTAPTPPPCGVGCCLAVWGSVYLAGENETQARPARGLVGRALWGLGGRLRAPGPQSADLQPQQALLCTPDPRPPRAPHEQNPSGQFLLSAWFSSPRPARCHPNSKRTPK